VLESLRHRARCLGQMDELAGRLLRHVEKHASLPKPPAFRKPPAIETKPIDFPSGNAENNLILLAVPSCVRKDGSGWNRGTSRSRLSG
jgi:hypothetical protein